MDVDAERVIGALQRRIAVDARTIAVQAVQIDLLEIENTQLKAHAASSPEVSAAPS